MGYASYKYLLIFLGSVLLFYTVMPRRFKWTVLLAASYGFYLRVCFQDTDSIPDKIFGNQVISIHRQDIFTRSQGNSMVACSTDAAVCLCISFHLRMCRQFLCQGIRAVGRTVIHQNDLYRRVGRSQDGAHRLLQKQLHIVDRYHHRDQRFSHHEITIFSIHSYKYIRCVPASRASSPYSPTGRSTAPCDADGTEPPGSEQNGARIRQH